jgi:rubrerythrin
MTLEQAILRQQLQDLLNQERQAEESYAHLAAQTTDAVVKEQLLQLHREKQRHVRLTERLLEIVD